MPQMGAMELGAMGNRFAFLIPDGRERPYFTLAGLPAPSLSLQEGEGMDSPPLFAHTKNEKKGMSFNIPLIFIRIQSG